MQAAQKSKAMSVMTPTNDNFLWLHKNITFIKINTESLWLFLYFHIHQEIKPFYN